MPIYPYICNECGHEFDKLQKISDEPLRSCPECGEEALRKKVTAAAFRLKGTGWYETDFKDNKNKKDDKKDGAKSDKKDSKTDAKKADSKAGDKSSGSSSSDSGTSSSSSKSSTSKTDTG